MMWFVLSRKKFADDPNASLDYRQVVIMCQEKSEYLFIFYPILPP